MSPHLRLRGVHITAFPGLEDLVFTLLSLAVVGALLSALVMPPQASLAATVTGIQPNAANQSRVILYGTLVDASGAPISGATISVYDSAGNLRDTAVSGSSGVFQLIRFKDTTDTYRITVTVNVNGTPTTGTFNLSMSPGFKYGVQVVFTPPATFNFVPIPGY